MCSPFSLTTVLAMTYFGARGQTAEELKQALAIPDDKESLLLSYREVAICLLRDFITNTFCP